jgi:threonine 3-dehydrogenase
VVARRGRRALARAHETGVNLGRRALLIRMAVPPRHTLIIGASGAIGKSLIAELTAAHGEQSVIACLHRTPLPDDLAKLCIQESGVSVLDEDSLRRVLIKHADTVDTVWMLAAPLSIDTARDPGLAHDITVGGMRRLLDGMLAAGLRKVCFSDSIGSFGATSPRRDATARWLVEHPSQDPGSDYGLQKRQCRRLLAHYATEHGFDTRWAVIPGVLHGNAEWGGGTTEYALEAIAAAVHGTTFACPVPMDTLLPMCWMSDLCAGLVALQDAPRATLGEPDGGYAIAGFSFTAQTLRVKLKELFPAFKMEESLDADAASFARLWPDTLSSQAATRDLGFSAEVGLDRAVQMAVAAHKDRVHPEVRAAL